ncbi:PDZ domain-containing protein [Sphingomicrobium marinum]|uniref:PDZ domain-containing protein n=1 Tax=Sphingomicrobium marinum TaxID=1227950 RepID=UPI00223FAEA3|nr:PDZ domain-containing protein [Sphingomicrobium marinum]
MTNHLVPAIVAIGLIVFPSAANADEYHAVTPSGATEMLFDVPAAKTSSNIANHCMNAKFTVISSAENSVVCEIPMNMGQQVLGQLLLGNSYSTTPKTFYRFNIATIDEVSRVQATGWMETQMAFGQIQRQEFNGPEFHNAAMTFLEGAGGRHPPGTTFPNHAVMGVTFSNQPRTKQGAMIDTVAEGSAAEIAGIKPGDRLYRVAGEKIKDLGDLLDGAAKGADRNEYEVEIYRDGKRMKVMLQRKFRDAVVAPALPAVPQPVVDQAPTVASASPLSLADELAKFAKLRDDGIISDEEFETQKAKLLSSD